MESNAMIEGNKKRICLVQATTTHKSEIPIPYSVGVLQAYAQRNAIVNNEYYFEPIIVEKTDINQAAKELSNADIVAFSSYIWNIEYNKAVAKKVKELSPKTVVIFGGHSIPCDIVPFMKTEYYVDFAIVGEGELSFEQLLLHLVGYIKLGNLKNIAYREGNDVICHYDENYIPTEFPSPYQAGIFDVLIEKYGSHSAFTATLETNRGCPFSCSYCDWGLNNVKIRMIPVDRVYKDIEWISKHGVKTCYCADSNFGMFEHDFDYARALVDAKRRFGAPEKFSVSYSKNSDDRVFEITKLFSEARMLQGATLSFQSLNEKTLECIGRKNLDLEYFQRLMKRYNDSRISTYSELILGLPEETLSSFKRGIGILLERGQHRGINVYNCELLPNSSLGQPKSIRQYCIRTARLPFRRFDIKKQEVVQEYSHTIIETSTLTQDEWCEANLFYTTIRALHCRGLTQYIFMMLHYYTNKAYDELYSDFILAVKNGEMNELSNLQSNILTQLWLIAAGKEGWGVSFSKKYRGKSFEDTIYGMFLEYEEEMYDLIVHWCAQYGIQKEILQETVRFQKYVVEVVICNKSSGKEVFAYDIKSLCENILLQKRSVIKRGTFAFDESDIRSLKI